MTITTMRTSLAGPTVDINDHLAAAVYLMKRHGPSRLAVVNSHRPGLPEGIITAADLARAAADGTDFEQTRVGQIISPLTEATVIWDALPAANPQEPCLTLVVCQPYEDLATRSAV
jgi:CBS domain-containing protein